MGLRRPLVDLVLRGLSSRYILNEAIDINLLLPGARDLGGKEIKKRK